MVITHQQFSYKDQIVIEKLVVKTPMKQSPVFQNEACFLYFKSGEALLTSSTETAVVQPEEGVLLKCGNYFGDIIQRSPSGISEVFVVHLFPEMLKEIYKEEIPSFIKRNPDQNRITPITNKSLLKHFIDSLSFYFENRSLFTHELLQLKIKELILLLLQTSSGNTVQDLFASLFTPRKSTLLEVVDAHLYSSLALEQLAVLTGQSLSTFKRAFKQHFNQSPAAYIRDKKLARAQELLSVSDYSVSEISYKVGYEDSSYFSRLFSNTFHISPTEYRLLHK